MLIKPKCPYCNKVKELNSEIKAGKEVIQTLKCGHTVVISGLSVLEQDIISEDGKSLYPFQKESVDFLEKASGRGLIAHDTGLGKTVIALALLKKHPEMLPALIVTKSAVKYQWFKQCFRWIGYEQPPQVIDKSKDKILEKFPIQIISHDLCQKVEEKLVNRGYKTIVIDETQQIKNTKAGRTYSIRKIAQGCEFVLGLSATPFKNHAGEYYSILATIKPEMFPSYDGFVRRHCYLDFYGKVKGLKSPDEFRDMIAPFVLRYSREDVLPDLPKINRNPFFTDLGDTVNKAYQKLLDEFVDEYEATGFKGFQGASNKLAYFAKMRHLTGIAKINDTVEICNSFMEENERKLVIFVHHKDVAEIMMTKLAQYKPLALRSDQGAEDREFILSKFRENGNRLLIASALAGGEGIDLQCASDAIMHERQWNPANEEQAEGRFPRIGQLASSINITYMTALGTIDEYFSNLVEQKRQIFKEAMGDKDAYPWDETEMIELLTQELVKSGRKKWVG